MLLAAMLVIVAVVGAGFWLIRGAAPQSDARAPSAPSEPVRVASAAPFEVQPGAALAAQPEAAPDPAEPMQRGAPVPLIAPPATSAPALESATSTSAASAAVSRPTNDLVPLSSDEPGAGKAGLVDALRAGHLRLASDADLQDWIARSHQPVSVGRLRFNGGGTYVIVDDFTIPSGLTGADSAVFLLPRGVPFPRGDAGHSVVLDLSTGACAGVTCSMLRD
ncbi:hypothetical protein [Lysobacter claricitrinus]|uniref:hypothetical protein n=1 Tax=Lysobacter claricitrinus TaxID=3367728 RepID=UPI0038B2AAFC